jgi:hypothetical protein
MTEPVIVDVEATVKAEVAKAFAAAKAAEVSLVTKVKAFVNAHYSKVVAAVVGFATAHFGVIESLLKLI